MLNNKSKIYLWATIISLFFICFLSIRFFQPIVDGDGPTYVEAINVLKGNPLPLNFVPNRILTTFASLQSVIILGNIFGSVEAGWITMNILFFFIINLIFYKLIFEIFKDEKVAFISTLFLASNYAMISFGLDYWMDIGGWTFYLLSIYFSLKYVQTQDKNNLLYSSFSIGIGALFKEYAFLAIIPIAFIIIYDNWPKVLKIVKDATVPALISLIPIFAIYIYVFNRFNYTYIKWLSVNGVHYIYNSRIIEYIKSFGSLYNFLAFIVLIGLYCFIFQKKNNFTFEKRTNVFFVSIIFSVLPVFIWPAITQRILFITVPAMTIFASFAIKKYEKYYIVFYILLALYIFMNFLMDSYVLPNFNLPF